MTQAREILATISPVNDLEEMFDYNSSVSGREGELSEMIVEADSIGVADVSSKKSRKLSATPRRRGQSKKKPFTEDSIRVYLQEIGRIRLLRAEEEIELARQIADLLDLEYIRSTLIEHLGRVPTDEEWAIASDMPNMRQFNRRLHIGRKAKDKMVQSNLRLVVSIAKKYMNRGLSFQDLIQEGSLGLIRAAEKFDHEKGYKFSTYATWWIRQAITRAIADQSRTIRLPVHLYETISRIKKNHKDVISENGTQTHRGRNCRRYGNDH